ncbi:CFDP2 [Symbiodinium necroappetens]|uniref:CFDP2 protein n=1 Tax=Symbiodinium necroappetens TaxID=1628268 RepID=A0A813ANW1_9DINO|nr:CFDP2 [Symbiodinium necroappetens]
MGGCSSDAYDVLCDWLERQHDLGVLLLQETHWGLGHTESQWSTNGWTWFSSPDPARRYAGVAIVVSHRLAPATACTFCAWVPGRVLQVRVECDQLNIDLVTVYQWVREVSYSAERQEQRTQIWHQLGRVVHSIPKRNLLLVGGDFNAGLQAHTNLIGKGLLQGSADRVDQELQDLIEANQLCVLNTWGSNRPSKCATFCNGQQRSQIDYLMVRKHAADHIARSACPNTEDLTPWRQGPKHRKLGCSIPQLAGGPALASAAPDRTLCCLSDAGATPAVKTGIGHMWALHRALRARRPGTSFLQIMAAWKRIRSPTGNVLTQREQFDAIYQYFSTVFQRQDTFQHTTLHTAVAFSAAEVEQAITALKLSACAPAEAGTTVPSALRSAPTRSIDEAILRVCHNCDRIKAAGTPSDLCEMVMDLHEQCHYSIRHHKHTGQFPMQLGVRQGCSLSPLLFATFTGFFYEALRERTDATWAAAFVTLFADDTMLQWHIESEARHRTKDGFVLRLGTPTRNMEPGDQAMAEQARREAAEVFGAPPLETGDKSRRESTEGLEDWAGRKPKWNRPASKGQQSYGKGNSGGSWKDPKDPWSYEPAPLGEQEQEFLRNVAKMLMRHESEMRLLRQDTTWMMFVDTQEQGVLSLIQEKSAKWQELYQEKKVTSSLRTVLLIGVFQELATRLQALLQDQDRLTKMHSVGWLVNGEQALNPKWVYQQWSPEKQTVEVSPQAPITYSLALDAIQAVINNVGGPGVLLRFRSTRPLTEKITGEVMPFALVLSMRGQLAMQVHQALGILSGCACLKVAGLRVRPDRGQQSTLAKALEDSYTGLSFADWKPRDRKWQRQQSQWTQEGPAMEGAETTK